MNWKDEGNLYILWLMTIKCNYRCSYCFQKNERKRDRYQSLGSLASISGIRKFLQSKGKTHNHAFKNYSPEEWLEAFSRLHGYNLSMKISGGEPFLDRINFTELLNGLTGMDHVQCIRVDTNGSWNAKNFSSVNWEKITLNVSFHPEAITEEDFLNSMINKLDSGIKIGMVNYVMAPNQYRNYASFSEKLAEIGVYANPNVYFGPNENEPSIVESYPRYLPRTDIAFKRKKVSPRGRSCYFPSRAYEMDPCGLINRGCIPAEVGNFFDRSLPKLPSGASSCPFNSCGCLDKYAFHEDFTDRTGSYDLLDAYVQACRKIWDPMKNVPEKIKKSETRL